MCFLCVREMTHQAKRPPLSDRDAKKDKSRQGVKSSSPAPPPRPTFKAMRKDGVQPSPTTYTTAITACSRTADWKRALMLLVEMRTAFPSRALHVAAVTTPSALANSSGAAATTAVAAGRKARDTLLPSRADEKRPDLDRALRGPLQSGVDGNADAKAAAAPEAAAAAAAMAAASAKEEARGLDSSNRGAGEVGEGSFAGPDWWGRGNVHDVFGFGAGAAGAAASPAAAKDDGRRRRLRGSQGVGDGSVVGDDGKKESVDGYVRGAWGKGAGVSGRIVIADGQRAAYNAAINVCGRAGRWDRALCLLEVG